jgi:hypothetical protein
MYMYMQCGNDRRYHHYSKSIKARFIASSHLVKHTADIVWPSRRPPWMLMVMMQLRASHSHLLWLCWHAGRHASGPWGTWPGHGIPMSRVYCLSVVHLGLSSHAATPQSRILVAVAPAVDCSLNQAPLASQAGVQLCERPTDVVAFGLVRQSISLVLVLGAARPRVDTVLGLEVLGKIFDVDGFNVAADGVLHLDTVARVLERNPLNAVLVLSHDQRRGGGNRTRRCVGVDVGVGWPSWVHVWRSNWRALRRRLRWAESRRWSLQRGLRHP